MKTQATASGCGSSLDRRAQEIGIKVAEGRSEEVRPCIVCSRCLDNIFTASPASAQVNPARIPSLGQPDRGAMEPSEFLPGSDMEDVWGWRAPLAFESCSQGMLIMSYSFHGTDWN